MQEQEKPFLKKEETELYGHPLPENPKTSRLRVETEEAQINAIKDLVEKGKLSPKDVESLVRRNQSNG